MAKISVIVAQRVERRLVTAKATGSRPVDHPKFRGRSGAAVRCKRAGPAEGRNAHVAKRSKALRCRRSNRRFESSRARQPSFAAPAGAKQKIIYARGGTADAPLSEGGVLADMRVQVSPRVPIQSGCSSVWRECPAWNREVRGSNPRTPTNSSTRKETCHETPRRLVLARYDEQAPEGVLTPRRASNVGRGSSTGTRS
jgi:hypothetical protein